MTLDEYQNRLCSVHKKDMWWGVLTIELSVAVGSICGIWSSIVNCPLNVSDEQFDSLNTKLYDKLGDVFNILARLNAYVNEPLSNIYKVAHHAGMGDGQPTKYILRLAKSASEFLCPDLTRVNHDVRHIITENSILIMHDMINIVLSLKDRSMMAIVKDNLLKVLSKEKSNVGNHGS